MAGAEINPTLGQELQWRLLPRLRWLLGGAIALASRWGSSWSRCCLAGGASRRD